MSQNNLIEDWTGDSFSHKSGPPREFMFALRRWLKTCFDLDLEDGGDCMPHGQQNDTFNCGPATGNTIAHDVLGCQLWSPETAVLERVRWFLKFVENIPSLVEDISLESPSQDNGATQAAAAGRSEMSIEVSIAIAIGDFLTS